MELHGHGEHTRQKTESERRARGNGEVKGVCAAFFWMLAMFGLFTVEAGAAGEVIRNITTAGNRAVGTAEILGQVRSRVGEVFDAERAAEDVKRIAALPGVQYAYYNTQVVEGQIDLTFVVIEKNIIRSIDFVGNKAFSKKTLTKKAGLKLGDYLDPVIADVGVDSLVDFYRKKGFAFVKVGVDSEQEELGKLVYVIVEGPRVKLSSISFVGNESIPAKDLREVIKTSKRKYLLWQAYYAEERVANDVLKLQNVYLKEGYLDSKVKAEPVFSEDKAKVALNFVIRGNEHFDEAELQETLKVSEGSVYSARQAESGAEEISLKYKEVGYIDVDVEQTRQFTTGSAVDITYDVNEGQRFRIGQIQISGNENTQDKVIRQILDEYEFQPGNWYNGRIARGQVGNPGYLERLVQQTAYMEDVLITPSGAEPGQRDAQVSVVEGQTGSIMLGAGVASDSGVIGQLVFEQRNFDISNTPESLSDLFTGKAFRGAGQILRVSLMPGTQVSEYVVSFTEPYLYSKPVSLDVLGSSFERFRESYDEGRTKGFVGLEKRYTNKWRRSIGFKAEDVDITDIDFDAPQQIKDFAGNTFLPGVRLGVGRDLTDDRFYPGTGYSFNVSYEQNAGDETFGVLSGILRNYATLSEDLAERKTILATRLMAGTTIGDAPFFDKFYAGGQGSIRGFEYRGVSPRGLQTNVPNPKREDPIGSDWLFLASAEVTRPLVGQTLSYLVFADSGLIQTGGLRLGVGTGVQIMIPQWFGPVPMRFELGFPVLKNSEDDTQVFSFSIGRLF
jgi:outer membrane protein insertion porin family